MLLRFQKAAVRGNYATGNQAFSMRLRFLTIRLLNLAGFDSLDKASNILAHMPGKTYGAVHRKINGYGLGVSELVV
jgi:hypothetical protein